MVHSPFFTNHADTIRFFELLEPYYPDFSMADEEVARLWNPKKPLPVPRIRVLRTYLTNLLHEFYLQQQLRTKPGLKTELLAQYQNTHGQLPEAQKVLEAQLSQSSEEGFMSIDESMQVHRLWVEMLDLQLQIENRVSDSHVGNVLESLDTFYLSTRMKYLCTVLSLGFHLSVEIPNAFLEETLELYQKIKGQPQPLVRIYYHLVNLLRDAPMASHYEALKTLVQQYGGKIHREERVNIFGFWLNYLNTLYYTGSLFAMAEMLRVYELMADWDILFGRGKFSAHSFRNIAVVGARLGEFNWTRNFIAKYAEKLDAELRDGLANYCLAYLDFTEGKYPDALRKLQFVEFLDPFYRTGVQILMLRIFFEIEDSDAFFALSSTFRRYLNRNKLIAASHRKASLNFLSIAGKLLQARMGPANEQSELCEKLTLEIEGCDFLTDKRWLKEKLAKICPN